MNDTELKTNGMSPPGEVCNLTQMISYGDQSIVSRTLVNQKSGSLTLFAFDSGQRLSEHTSPFEAFVHVLDGTGEFVIGGRSMSVSAGEAVLMPAGVPHAVVANERFKMLLGMFKQATP